MGYLSACVLAGFLAGCSGCSGDQGEGDATTTTSSAENFVEIAAVPGPIVAARVGDTVLLEDNASFARSSDALAYNWSFSHKPSGSHAVLQNADSSTPSFVADVRGVYMLQLVVSAEGNTSQRAISTVVVTHPSERPTGPFNHPGLSSNCVNCHNDDFASIPGKSLDHIATSNTCQACHTPQGFDIIPFADHQEVFGNCSQCHNGVVAIGKSEFHTPTEAPRSSSCTLYCKSVGRSESTLAHIIPIINNTKSASANAGELAKATSPSPKATHAIPKTGP